MISDGRELYCLRCDTKMKFAGRERFQLGEESYHSGILAVMTAESACMDIYKCPGCGKIEFFQPGTGTSGRAPVTDWTCSQCGTDNSRRVQSCQGCGVTREWSEKQRKDR